MELFPSLLYGCAPGLPANAACPPRGDTVSASREEVWALCGCFGWPVDLLAVSSSDCPHGHGVSPVRASSTRQPARRGRKLPQRSACWRSRVWRRWPAGTRCVGRPHNESAPSSPSHPQARQERKGCSFMTRGNHHSRPRPRARARQRQCLQTTPAPPTGWLRPVGTLRRPPHRPPTVTKGRPSPNPPATASRAPASPPPPPPR